MTSEPAILTAGDAVVGEDTAATPGAPCAMGVPRFEIRTFWTPKRGNTADEWEDGFETDPDLGALAIADGATDGVFTKPWVRQLLASYREHPIALTEMDAVESWIGEQRRAWFESLNYPSLRLSLQRKVDRSCAAATFLAFLLDPESAPCGVGWTAWAVGDVCLFHVRAGELIATFPITRSEDFGVTPPLYQSRPIQPMPRGAELRGELLPDDTLLFATDAQACRLLSGVEACEPVSWEAFWHMELDDWRAQIEHDRDAGKIVNDDCTLLLLRLPRSIPAPEIEEPAASAEIASSARPVPEQAVDASDPVVEIEPPSDEPVSF